MFDRRYLNSSLLRWHYSRGAEPPRLLEAIGAKGLCHVKSTGTEYNQSDLELCTRVTRKPTAVSWRVFFLESASNIPEMECDSPLRVDAFPKTFVDCNSMRHERGWVETRMATKKRPFPVSSPVSFAFFFSFFFLSFCAC